MRNVHSPLPFARSHDGDASIRSFILRSAIAAAIMSPWWPTDGRAQVLPPIAISAPVDGTYTKLLSSPAITKLLADIEADDAWVLREHRVINEIAAPSFKEGKRAAYFLGRLKALGLKDAYIDSQGNAIGILRGSGSGPRLVFTAHLDTVFPEDADVRVVERDGVLHAPGIGDDARGLAVLLSTLKVLRDNNLKTVGDIVFVASVGEELLGNLRGMKALFRDLPDLDGLVGLEPALTRDARIVGYGTATHRYEVSFHGPGGLSFSGFGAPSAINAMGRAIGKIADTQVPATPKTTFNIGIVGGGKEINQIASDANMTLEIRSNSTASLLSTESTILAGLADAVADENKRWNKGTVGYDLKLVGDRPGGQTPPDAIILQAASRSVTALTGERPVLTGASTDANLPMSIGVPAVVMGSGGLAGGFHAADEWFDPAHQWIGEQAAVLAVLGLVGVDGVSEPLLVKRSAAAR